MMTELKANLNRVNNFSMTENGAIGYKTTGTNLVDLNFVIPSMRAGVNDDNKKKFMSVLDTELKYAVKWMFYIRDIRGGLGERDTFISFFNILSNVNPEIASKVVGLIPEFGRWKDLIDILESSISKTVLNKVYETIHNQLSEDCKNMVDKKPISLLAKWLPSINASGKARKSAIKICKNLELSYANYRKMLAKLRSYLDVTEVKTCSGDWNEIDYNKVSSNANLRYKDAFMKHDENRRTEYLLALLNPANTNVVMHAQTLYPYEVYAKYSQANWTGRVNSVDLAVESLWKNLKQIDSVGKTMVIVDDSGSMKSTIPNTSVRAIDVSRSLGVYFAERCEGEFKNQMIEFSSNPHFIDIRNCNTLAEKVNVMNEYDDYSNTDIEKTFDLILDTAVRSNMKQEDLPDNLLIVSDMEFDRATTLYGYLDWVVPSMDRFKTLFETIEAKWKRFGYKMPKLIFWNVNSRTNTIPVNQNEAGVILVSGFSVNIADMVMSGEIDPWKALKKVLDSDRYKIIDEVI